MEGGSLRRQGSTPSRMQTKAMLFPLADMSSSLPSEQVVSEEMAEAAKGLAGLECLELYGPSPAAPPLTAPDISDSDRQKADRFQLYALASCMATPTTGEDKNLGELVEGQARMETQAADTRLAEKFERQLDTEITEDSVALVRDREDPSLRRRRRVRGADKLGSGAWPKKEKITFEDCPEAERKLTIMASLDESTNRIELQPEDVCVGDFCYPIAEVSEEEIFGEPPPNPHLHPRPLNSSITA